MTTTEKKTIKIAMSEQAPVIVDPEVWGLIADAEWYEGEHKSQANRTARIKVREHDDGRCIVYGSSDSAFRTERDEQAGYLVPSKDGQRDKDEVIRAIRRVAGVIGHAELAADCIADLPAEELV